MAQTPETPPCPVCSSDETCFVAHARDTEYCTTDQTYAYVQCGVCEALFLDSPPVDQLHTIYPPNYYSYRNDGGVHSVLQMVKSRLDARLFKRLLDRLPGDELSVLDVGGGSGWLLTQIRQVSRRISETHEVDIDEGAQAAAERAGHRFHCMSIEEFEPREKFDLILMLNIIEHVADPGRVLRAVERCLTPGGLILIKTPNSATLDRWIFQNRNWGGFHCPRHFVIFTRAGFVELATKCGLECIEARYTQGAPQWATSVLGLLSLKGWISVTAERPMYRHVLYGPLMAIFAAFDFIRSPFSATAQMWVTLKKGSRPAG